MTGNADTTKKCDERAKLAEIKCPGWEIMERLVLVGKFDFYLPTETYAGDATRQN